MMDLRLKSFSIVSIICQLFLTRKCRNTDNGDVEVRRSKINVIDLAGSECANVHTDEYARSKANV